MIHRNFVDDNYRAMLEGIVSEAPDTTKQRGRTLILVDEAEAALRGNELAADASLRRFKALCVAASALVFSAAVALASVFLFVNPRSADDRAWAGIMLPLCAFTIWRSARFVRKREW